MLLQVHSRHSGHECASKTWSEGWLLWLSLLAYVRTDSRFGQCMYHMLLHLFL